MRVLLVEDDAMIGETVADSLRTDGIALDWARDGESADTALRTHDYDLLLLDLGLPRRDGLSVLEALRGRGQALPVLITTARDRVDQRIAGLDAGADDYLTKPYDLDELHARIRALVRRANRRLDPAWRWRDLVVDPVARVATRGGTAIALSGREWAVLGALIARPGITLSRSQLEEKLYGWSDEVASNAVEVYIHGLRRKLGADAIRNVRGVGYRVAGDDA
ncbi:MAG: response regulator [Lautropia sp.]